MKISEILKNKKLFSSDIKQRFANGQIKLDGEVIRTDLEIGVSAVHDAGDFIFALCQDEINVARLKLFGIEGFFAMNENLRHFRVLDFSKKDKLILETT